MSFECLAPEDEASVKGGETYNDDAMENTDLKKEMMADAWLTTAIESKRIGMMEACIDAHLQMMMECPSYKTTDAIRLLGLNQDHDGEASRSRKVVEISRQGLFEASDVYTNERTYSPSLRAVEIGNRIREVFSSCGYRLPACQIFLHPYIQDLRSDGLTHRIFSAQSFIQHRREFLNDHRRKPHGDDSNRGKLEILVWVFLFGLAIESTVIVNTLGSDTVDLLLEARLLRTSPVEPDTMMVGEVQIYPVDIGLFLPESSNSACLQDKTYCLFATDWSIESLRDTHNAIMPVGYDSLELMALVAGEIIRMRQIDIHATHLTNQDVSPCKQILDLCCGCGIQGIFAFRCFMACQNDASGCKLVLSDVNERAINFVTANLALNGIPSNGSCGERSVVVCGNLFQPVSKLQDSSYFDIILCNPPFVAIPSGNNDRDDKAVKTPLYGVGGGFDGMNCLRRILRDLYHHLSNANPKAIALMVTEVPNVENSPSLLESFLLEMDRKRARIRVAFIEDDVETIGVYAKEREVEDGMEGVSVHNDRWLSAMINAGIHNRALVLLSLARNGIDDEIGKRLFKFESVDDGNDADMATNDTVQRSPCVDYVAVDPVDEEDMFLHPRGMEFARNSLLFPRS